MENASFIDLVVFLPRDVEDPSAGGELARPRPPRPRPPRPRLLLSPRPRDDCRDPLPRPRAGLANGMFLVSSSSSKSPALNPPLPSSSSLRDSPGGLLARTRLITSRTSVSSCFTFFRRSSLYRITSVSTVSSVAFRFFKYTCKSTHTHVTEICWPVLQRYFGLKILFNSSSYSLCK